MCQLFKRANKGMIAKLFIRIAVMVMPVGPVGADIAGPGWIAQTAPMVSPEEAVSYYESLASASPSRVQLQSANIVESASVALISDPEIIELARALQNDPVLMYEYVLNHIDYAPYYGHLKGPVLTLLERSGNDFDQAELLIALLRAAGHTAVFVHGSMFIPTMGAPDQRDIAHWIDVSPDVATISAVLGSGGIPGSVNVFTTQLARVWVRITTGTGTYDLDPAFKVYDRLSGVDLGSAMGYSRASMLAAAGGTAGTDYVQNLDEAGIGSQLVTYADTLSSYLEANHANSDMIDVVGGKQLRTTKVTALPTGLPFSSIVNGTWTEIPAQYIHTVRIQIGSLVSTLDIPDVAGKRLSLLVGKNVDSPTPSPYPFITKFVDYGTVNYGNIVDNVVLTYNNTGDSSVCLYPSFDKGADGGGAFSIIGPASVIVPPGGNHQVTVRFDATNQLSNGTKKAAIIMDAGNCWSFDRPRIDGVIIFGELVGAPKYELLLEDSRLAIGSVMTGGSSSIDLIVTVDHKYADADFGDQTTTYTVKEDSKYVIISDFGGSQAGLLLKQRQEMLEQYRTDGFADTSQEVILETLNVMGQTWMRQTTVSDNLLEEITGTHVTYHHRFGLLAQESGYYVDVKTQYTSAIARNPSFNKARTFGKMSGFIGSALEHGVLEQLQGVAFPAVSTVKLIKLANANGTRIYRVDSDNISAIQPQLTGYSAADMAEFQGAVNNTELPATLILPADGQIALQQWRGKGYVSYGNLGNVYSVGMIIGGGYFGGFGVIPTTIQPVPVFNNYVPKLKPVMEIQRTKSVDPVDLHTGDYLYENTDLALGGAGSRGLQFARYYDSGRRNQKSVLGHGWTHNYDIFLSTHSDAGLGLGLRQPVDAAAMLVAFVVGVDSLSSSSVLIKEWVVAVLVAQWAIDELFENAVSVHKANQSLTFIKQTDGSYTSPPGVTANLVKAANGLFSLQDRFDKTIDFNDKDKISAWRDADGNTINFTYIVMSGNNEVRLTKVHDDYGHELLFTYNGSQVGAVADSSGRTVGFTFDLDGNLWRYTDADNKFWRYSYTDHRMTSLQDPLLTTIATNVYDSLDRVKTQTVPRDSGTATFKFYFSDFRNIEEDPDGNQTIYFFDAQGRRVGVQDALGNTQRTEYDSQNHVIKQTDPRGNETQAIYDEKQNLRFTINALNQQTENIYDARNRLTRIKDPLIHTREFGYDTEHHLILTRDAIGNGNSATHYPDGQMQTNTDGRDTVTTLTYDPLGNPDTTRIGSHPILDQNYDGLGRLSSLTDQEGTTTSFIYNNRGQVTEITDPLLKKMISVYDDAGRLDTVTDRNLELTDFEYTPLGKLKTITYSDNSTVSFTYTQAMENLDTMADSLGLTDYSYDVVNRLTSQIDPNGFSVGYSYDEASNLVQLTYPGNKTVTNTYGPLNRLKTVTIDWLSQTSEYFYDPAGRLDYLVNFNGTVTDYTYDNADRLTGLTHTTTGGQTIASVQYPVLDGNGNRKQEVREEAQVPLSLATRNVSYVYNTQRNRLNSTTNDTFLYDDEGQTTNKSGVIYSWDAQHRLTGVGSDQYFYDGENNRLKAVRSGITTQYIYDSRGNLLAETSNSGAISRYYIHGLGMLAFVEGSQVFAYHHDPVGNTLAVTGPANSVVNAYSYTPYGQITDQQETLSQPFKYVGQFGVMAEPNGLYYMRARYYDSGTGRFISEDPAGLDAGVNFYAYVNGNPINHNDPSGLICLPCGLIAGTLNVGVSAVFDDNFTLQDGGVAFAAGFVGGLIPGASTVIAARLGAGTAGRFGAGIAGAAVGGGSANFASQRIGNGLVDPLQVGIAATGGALAAAATLPLGTSMIEIFSGGVIGSQFGFGSGAANAIRQRSLKP